LVSVLVTRPMTGWSAAKAADEAARDMAARARMGRELSMCVSPWSGDDAPAVLGSGCGPWKAWSIRAQGDYRTAERLNQVDLVIGNPG
jgi:hypothetical protein